MTENLKLIVQSTNKLLSTEYNLISFDSLSEDQLLQVLLDVFLKYGIIAAKWDVTENDPDETNKTIVEGLAKIQYSDEDTDMATLRRGLVRGDKKIIYPILEWVYENDELIAKLAYLSKFLMPLNLPPEAVSIAEVMTLHTQYELAMDEFKEVHQIYELSVQDGKKTRELRSDSIAIEGEIENVKKRIERLQTRLDKIPQHELLLESAKTLRIEKDKQKDLMTQLDEQKQALHRASVGNERLQKEHHNIKIATQGTTPRQMLDGIVEEVQVLEFMVRQKLPQEFLLRQSEAQILEDVINEPNVSRDYLQDVQYKIDEVNREVQRLVEAKMNDKSQQNDALGLGPFRQQAMVIARNKEAAAEQLDQLTKELKEVEAQLTEKQQKLQETVGDVFMRGDDLKQFVNTLRAKSNVYKQQRSELAAIKAEANDLQETLDNLRAQDPSLAMPDDEASSLEPMLSRPDSPLESRGVTELTRLVDGLTRAVVAAREKLQPMSQQLRPLRERIAELRDESDSKKQTYDALSAQLSSELAQLKAEYNETDMELKKLEEKWKDLKVDQERLEKLLEKAKAEANAPSDRSSNTTVATTTLRETLTMQLREQENTFARLKNQISHLQMTKADRKKQIELWSDLAELFEVKIKCFIEAKQTGIGGTMQVTNSSETFTLQ